MDTLHHFADSLAIQATNSDGVFNYWMVIALVEFVLIILLFARHKYSRRNISERERIKKKVMNEGDIDFGGIVNSAFNAQPLYDTLIRKCHPDRFAPDEDKMATANDITMRLGKSKHDHGALEQLKKEAIEKLNINL